MCSNLVSISSIYLFTLLNVLVRLHLISGVFFDMLVVLKATSTAL